MGLEEPEGLEHRDDHGYLQFLKDLPHINRKCYDAYTEHLHLINPCTKYTCRN